MDTQKLSFGLSLQALADELLHGLHGNFVLIVVRLLHGPRTSGIRRILSSDELEH